MFLSADLTSLLSTVLKVYASLSAEHRDSLCRDMEHLAYQLYVMQALVGFDDIVGNVRVVAWRCAHFFLMTL